MRFAHLTGLNWLYYGSLLIHSPGLIALLQCEQAGFRDANRQANSLRPEAILMGTILHDLPYNGTTRRIVR